MSAYFAEARDHNRSVAIRLVFVLAKLDSAAFPEVGTRLYDGPALGQASCTMNDAARFLSHETLRDGTAVVIRAARPDDRQRIADAFSTLGRESVYTRFFTFKRELSERELGVLDTMDFERDVMLVVTAATPAGDAVIASARCIAHDVADGRRAAEVAFTVTEPFQGKGIAGRLFEHLRRIAHEVGITRFEADVLPANRAMLTVFRRTGLPMTEQREDGVVHLTLSLDARE